MRLKTRRSLVALMAALLLVAAAACAEANSHAANQDVLGQAAGQATAIVQQAQATAMVLKAQTQATAMIENAVATPYPADRTPAPAPTLKAIVSTASPLFDQSSEATADAASTDPADAPQEVDSETVELLGVGFAADGGFIAVQFKAPPRVATNWWQGSIYIVDEDTEMIYNEIPVMPKIGPLIGKPVEEGQLGYAMLVNAPPYLQPGALVTVVLGDYTFEHVQVQ